MFLFFQLDSYLPYEIIILFLLFSHLNKVLHNQSKIKRFSINGFIRIRINLRQPPIKYVSQLAAKSNFKVRFYEIEKDM